MRAKHTVPCIEQVNHSPLARQVALKHLVQWETTHGEFTLELNGLEDTRDRALVNELVQGVLRHRLYLDWVINRFVKPGAYPLTTEIHNALRLGCYQLIFLDRVPPFAAVNETVNLVKGESGIKAGNLTNAILRTVQRERKTLDPFQHLKSSLEQISIATSHPEWLVRRWLMRWGNQKTLELCKANNERPPLTLRVNRLHGTREGLQENLRREGQKTLPSPVSRDALYLVDVNRLTDLAAYRKGLFYIQDEGAQWIAPLLSPQPGERILDICAAPGGKTTHLAELMENRGKIVALDLSPQRLSLLEENLERLRIRIVKPLLRDATQDLSDLGCEGFHRALVDVPCSGLGVLRRHPEGKWKKEESLIREYTPLQLQMLQRVAPLIKRGGLLVYSTCSTEPEENEEVVNLFLKNHPNFIKEETAFTNMPHADSFRTPEGFFSTLLNPYHMDHFFAARLRRDL